MNAGRWQQVNHIFHEALERDAATRETYIQQATAGDPELLREVQTLLASHDRAGEFLDRPAWAVEPELAFGEEQSLTGRQIGPYRILEEVGRGGMGVVYAAEDQRLRRTVALKALTPEYTRDPRRRERLTREARAAAALLHPAIATIFALEEIEGELYITSELVRGRTLRQELDDGPLPPSQLLAVLVTIADALAAAHERSIVHRDLKPENIIRRDDGQIKVLDFGLAQRPPGKDAVASTRLTEVGSALGTPGYMAPEQLGGQEVDARADIFAFGVLTWELATGEHPFGTDPASILARMTELLEGRTTGLTRTLPLPGLDRIARRCMRGNPAERYSSASALLVDLRALETGSVGAFALPRHDAHWWWMFHQYVVAIVNAAVPVALWSVRRWIERPRIGSWLFLIGLTAATISVALRLNLSFTARVHPAMLNDHRARVFPAIAAIDAFLAGLLFVAAALIAEAHDAIAAILVALAAVMLVSLSLIEPATTKAAGLNR